MNTTNLLILCATFLIFVAIICFTLIKWVKERIRAGQSMVNPQTNNQNFSDQYSSRDNYAIQSQMTKVFIAHSAKDEENKEKWEELKEALESMNYSVFDDSDSAPKNDIKFCTAHINSSQIIIVLVGDCEPFELDTGVFRAEMEHLGGNTWPEDKLIYICSYGIDNPLDLVVRKIINEKDKQYLVKLRKSVKTHNLNYNNMRRLASKIDSSYNKVLKKL